MLTITISRDSLEAELTYSPTYEKRIHGEMFTKEEIIDFLQDNKITYGLQLDNINKLVKQVDMSVFPILIAKGINKEDGLDGKVDYAITTSTEVDHSFSGDFKDIMRLPIVDKGKQIATLIPPTKGKNGMTVTGKAVKAKQGKPKLLRAGKNIQFNKVDQSYYALENGLLSFSHNVIHVYTVYEVNETLSMRTGNINFNGSVIIHGDVPSGFTIKATGDVKVFGLIEAANIHASGSVYVSEGLSGLKEGVIEAGEDIFIGYVNQGTLRAGRHLQVENSILHSDCSARSNITCYRGNIIGGTLFAGRSIEAKDIGNHMHTTTALSLGIDNKIYEEKEQFKQEKKTLSDNLSKIKIIRKKMGSLKQMADAKARIDLLKLTNSQKKIEERLIEIECKIDNIRLNYEEIDLSDVKVSGTIHPNTTISFGKYQRKINKGFKQVIAKLVQNDIMVEHYYM